MSKWDSKDFDDRLVELSNWQLEQQKKLKEFQEVQKKLLNLEHKNVLNSFGSQNFNPKVNDKKNDGFSQKLQTSISWDNQQIKSIDNNEIFQLKYPSLMLNELKPSIFNLKSTKHEEKMCNESDEGISKKRIEPKKFLRRGEGLARFRMTADDFRGAPKIYKDKKIKTYLNTKLENSPSSSRVSKSSINSVKVSKGSKNYSEKTSNKPVTVPVKIYVPNNKVKKCKPVRLPELNAPKKTNELSKTALQELALKPCKVATEWYNVLKEKEKNGLINEKFEELENQEPKTVELDADKKKDEKELQIFEFLESKVNDSSFCSNSSLVDKFMEHSLSSTPSKLFTSGFKKSYTQGLKSLQGQFLNDEQIKRFDELSDIPSEEIPDTEPEICKEVEINEADVESEKKTEIEFEETDCEPHKVNKTLLQQYIKDFKKFKNILTENTDKIEKSEIPNKPENDTKKLGQNSQQNIALKLRRKGLQDNVKQLLNWECSPRKKLPKRVVKKKKLKPPKTEKLKTSDKEQNEKVVLNSSLLKSRLEELEKEIEIFRKENKNLEKLQRECNDERLKLAREKKELERKMQEEREKLELRIAEEQKKLQKEKTVFEKYCKTVKNQPTRHEREEIANLRKEIEKLTETLSTKESRYGASQARLRNQLKNLEKENFQLKVEIEKHKKQAIKRVSFDNERNINAKIINIINTELGKLKPAIMKNAVREEQFQSSRIEKHVERKPIRRIKSVPNMKKQDEVDKHRGSVNDLDERAFGSVSTDSGIEANASRCVKLVKVGEYEDEEKTRALLPKDQRENFGEFQECKDKEECFARNTTGDRLESATYETMFEFNSEESTQAKISEIKNRLHRLTEFHSETFSGNMVKLPRQFSATFENREVEEINIISEEEEEEEEEEGDNSEHESENLNYWMKNYQSKNDPKRTEPTIVESRLEESGIWEKTYEDGSKEINYPNGNVKKIFPDKKIVKMVFYNGDVKETNIIEGSEKYYYAETKTWHTTYKDGLEVLEFSNGQTERRHPDGSTEVSFPNGCLRYCDSSGRDEWRFLDGTVIKTNENGHKILLMPNGQKEIHTKEYKRREYPDGTVKILYADGTQETRYASGRVRLKNEEGNLVMDSGDIR